MTSAAGSLDTNILLRFLLADDARQSHQSQALIEASKSLKVSILCIAEIVFIMEGKGFGRAAIWRNIETLSSVNNLQMPIGIILPATELYVKQPALSFIDACLAFEANAVSAEPLWTFDMKLAKQAPHTKLVA